MGKGLFLGMLSLGVVAWGHEPAALKTGWRFTREDPAGVKALTLEEMSDILDWPLRAKWVKTPRAGATIALKVESDGLPSARTEIQLRK